MIASIIKPRTEFRVAKNIDGTVHVGEGLRVNQKEGDEIFFP